MKKQNSGSNIEPSWNIVKVVRLFLWHNHDENLWWFLTRVRSDSTHIGERERAHTFIESSRKARAKCLKFVCRLHNIIFSFAHPLSPLPLRYVRDHFALFCLLRTRNYCISLIFRWNIKLSWEWWTRPFFLSFLEPSPISTHEFYKFTLSKTTRHDDDDNN